MTGIVVEHLDAVAHVRFTRPLTRNALNEEMIGALTEAYESLGHDKAVRTIVLSAEGKVFSAGADLAWIDRKSTRLNSSHT